MLPPMKLSTHRKSSRVLNHNTHRFKLLFFLFSLIIAVLLLVTIHMEYRNYLQRISAISHSTTFTSQQHMLRVMEAADLILQQVEAHVGNKKLTPIPNSKKGWKIIVKHADKLPQLRSLWLVDAKGKMLSYSAKYPTPKLNVADRDYFIQTKKLNNNYYLGAPRQGKYTGKPYFSISRAIRDSQGIFKGAIVAAIEPDYIGIFKNISPNHILNRIMITSPEGVIYSQYPYETDKIGKKSQDAIKNFLTKQGNSAFAGAFFSNNIFAYSKLKLGKLPLYVISKYGTANIAGSLWHNWSHVAIPLVVCYVLILALFIFLMKRMKIENTAKHKTEKALFDSEAKFKSYIENAPDGIFITNEKGEYLEVNKAACKITEYSEEELLKLTIFELIQKGDQELAKEHFQAVVKNGFASKELGVITKYHEKRFWNVEAVALSEKRFLGFAKDITERKLAENEKIKLQEQLAQNLKMDAIGQLAGGVAHDFNNILAGIMGASDLLKIKKSNLSPKNLELVNLILRSTERAADLTGKLLAFGRKSKISSTTIDMHSIIQEALSILSSTIDKKITLSAKKEATNSIVIGDSTALQNALMNLAINASHAIANSGEIQINTKNIVLDKIYCQVSPFNIRPGEYLDIEIRDTGKGISSENLNKIFEPFFTTKKQGEGTGLGLAAVYGTIQEHHGAITVYSEIESGTVFHIFLACSEKNFKTNHKLPIIVPGSGKILLVDDEEIIRLTGKSMLEEMGYTVTLAKNGTEALELFSKEYSTIDAVILDMIMPEMNGTEAFIKMKEIDAECKIILASGFTKDESLNELRAKGLLGFIQKPFRNFELSKLLTDVMHNS